MATKKASAKAAVSNKAKNKFPRPALTGLRQAASILAKASERAEAKELFTKEEVIALQAQVSTAITKLDEFLKLEAQGPDDQVGT
jgi:hypothetical protein